MITLNSSAFFYSFVPTPVLHRFEVVVRAWTITILTFMKVTNFFFVPVLRISFLSRLRTPIHTGWKAVWNVCSFRKKELSRFASSFLSRCLYVVNRNVAYRTKLSAQVYCAFFYMSSLRSNLCQKSTFNERHFQT